MSTGGTANPITSAPILQDDWVIGASSVNLPGPASTHIPPERLIFPFDFSAMAGLNARMIIAPFHLEFTSFLPGGGLDQSTYESIPLFASGAGTLYAATAVENGTNQSGGHSTQLWAGNYNGTIDGTFNSGGVPNYQAGGDARFGSSFAKSPITGSCWTYAELAAGGFGFEQFIWNVNPSNAETINAGPWRIDWTVWEYPTITSIDESNANPAGGTRVHVNGTEFYGEGTVVGFDGGDSPSFFFTDSGVQVLFDGVPGTSVRWYSDGRVSAIAPAHAAGMITLTVRLSYTAYGCGTQDATFPFQYGASQSVSITGSGGEALGGGIVGGGFDLSGFHLGINGGNPTPGGAPASLEGCIVTVSPGTDSSGGSGCLPSLPTGSDSAGGSGCGVSL